MITNHNEMIKRVRAKVYAEARRYWQETGDLNRLALNDNDLDEQFWLIDADGIPRLKSEQNQVQVPQGSLYQLAEEAIKARIQFQQFNPLSNYDDLLNAEFANDLSREDDPTTSD